MDAMEFLNLLLCLGTLLLVLLIMVRWSVFDINTKQEYDFIKYFSIVLLALSALGMFRFDLGAKRRAHADYTFKMKEYEILRTKWLEITSKKMEMESSRTLESMNVVKTAQVVVQAATKEEQTPTNEDE
ncbi:hypothetical protein N9M83_04235 [Candidatus Poseidonia alphae]|nr:hypothetical protein [Candidatus Poseidonia alphae]MDC0625796.1 hypothetical protein [Candidatus Poseidonia alphae]